MVDATNAADSHVFDEMQRQAMAKVAEVLAVECELVELAVGRDHDLKWLVGSDGGSVSFFSAPFSIVEVIADDSAFVRSNAHVKDDVLVGCWRMHEVNYASEVDLKKKN